mmetsp:Transcript_32321/g.106689  ORF Transcript_32321/g.106689 Transcript_32321/m.106689 type:complete len:205 (-) Transcript_32321:817-1431(-)
MQIIGGEDVGEGWHEHTLLPHLLHMSQHGSSNCVGDQVQRWHSQHGILHVTSIGAPTALQAPRKPEDGCTFHQQRLLDCSEERPQIHGQHGPLCGQGPGAEGAPGRTLEASAAGGLAPGVFGRGAASGRGCLEGALHEDVCKGRINNTGSANSHQSPAQVRHGQQLRPGRRPRRRNPRGGIAGAGGSGVPTTLRSTDQAVKPLP